MGLRFTGGEGGLPPSATTSPALQPLLLLVFRQAFTCAPPNLMTAKTIPDTQARCGKRQGSKINANKGTLLGLAPRENKPSHCASTFHLQLILRKMEGRCLVAAVRECFWGGLRGAAAEKWQQCDPAGVEKPPQYDAACCNLLVFQEMLD